jgi:hypothetical protein
MAAIFNARLLVTPSFVEPEMIVTMAQASGFLDGLGGGRLRVKLGAADKFVYINRIDVKTAISANQASHNALPSATITAEYFQTATYRLRTRAEYSELDVSEAGEWNVALPLAYRLAARQGIFQGIRSANLYGINAANGEGLLNTPNATAVNLPPDSYGDSTLTTYDAGQLAIWFLGQIQAALTRLLMIGTEARVVIEAPQRVIGQMQMQNVVQLTSFQRQGAGAATTAQMIQQVLEAFGYELSWAIDDTLIGKGASGADAVLIIIPEVIVPKMPGINTNEFASISPSLQATTLQYADVAAPVEIVTPIPEGVDMVSQMRISSGWCPRGQAITILSIPN